VVEKKNPAAAISDPSVASMLQVPEQIEAVEENQPEHIAELDAKFKDKLLKDFGPILLGQFSEDKCLEYESFDKCVDEYFSQLDKQRE
jgi:hypothetical protein